MSEHFGRYTLLRRLAVGGMAEIFLSSLHGDAGFAKTVVVKRILPSFGKDQDFVNMFINEAVLAAQLTHPNVVSIYDFGVINDSYFMAMEYVQGIDLHTLAQHLALAQPLASGLIGLIGEGCARGLSYAHNMCSAAGTPQCIVHRDISPHNIMLSTEGEVKIMDFGIAKTAARFSRTLTGTIKGKLGYMSPEQANGDAASHLSDQFALGVVLWELAANQRLFGGNHDAEIIQRVQSCVIPDLTMLRPDMPKQLCHIIDKMLAKDPNKRFSDIQTTLLALEQIRAAAARTNSLPSLRDLARQHYQLAIEQAPMTNWSLASGDIPPAGTRKLAATPRQKSWQPLKKPYRQMLRRTMKMHNLSASVLPRQLFYLSLILFLSLFPAVGLYAYTAHINPVASDELVFGVAQIDMTTFGPAVDVYYNDAHLGTTPLHRIDVPAGHVRLRLENPKTHIFRYYEINLAPQSYHRVFLNAQLLEHVL